MAIVHIHCRHELDKQLVKFKRQCSAEGVLRRAISEQRDGYLTKRQRKERKQRLVATKSSRPKTLDDKPEHSKAHKQREAVVPETICQPISKCDRCREIDCFHRR